MRSGEWVFDDLAGDDGEWDRHVVSDGRLVVSPRPTARHEHVVWALLGQLVPQMTGGWQVRAQAPVWLGRDGRTADLAVFRRTAEDDERELGLLVEVVSRSSRRTDRFVKPAEYARGGVPAYWRVELEPFLLAGYALSESHFREEVSAGAGVVAPPAPIPLRVDLDALRQG